jgi:hypothetical protein
MRDVVRRLVERRAPQLDYQPTIRARADAKRTPPTEGPNDHVEHVEHEPPRSGVIMPLACPTYVTVTVSGTDTTLARSPGAVALKTT